MSYHEIKEKIKIYLATNKNEHSTTQNLWDTVKAVQRRKFIALQAYFKKQEKNSNKQANITHKRTGKATRNKAQSK